MKFMKLSSIVLLSLFFMVGFASQAHAKHHRHRTHSSFGVSVGISQPAPRYIAYHPAPAPVVLMPYYAPTPVRPVYYAQPCYIAPVLIDRPQPCVYIGPQFSFSFTH